MKLRCRCRGLVLACASGVLGAAQAATAPAEPAEPPGYVDRVIENLPPDTADEDSGYTYDREGMPRFLRLETRLGTQPFDARRQVRLGVAVYGLLETPNHGALSIDGQFTPADKSGTFTLRQRGLPLVGGWLANHELGFINSLTPAITRLPSRVFVPTAYLQGVSAEWENPAQGLQLQATAGEPGRLEILPATGFERLAGRRWGVGAQWHLGAADSGAPGAPRRGWTLALQHDAAQGVSDLEAPTRPEDFVDARSTRLAARHDADRRRLQGQFISTESDQLPGKRSGFWLDGEWDEGPRQHGAGLYRLDPGLTWAALPLANDAEGAYLRTSWRTRQWSTEASIDWLQSVSGQSSAGLYAATSARWRLDRSSSLGAGVSARTYAGKAWSSFADWRWQHGIGTSGLRLESNGGTSEPASQWLTYDHEWLVPQGWSLASSLGAGRVEADTRLELPAESLWSAAVSLVVPLTSRASLRGNASGEHGSSGLRRRNLNLGASWQIDPRWSLEGSLIRSTGRSRTSISIDPLAPPLPELSSAAYRSFFAVLRYERQAGSRSVPLGGKPQDGGGRIEGTVYFDANRSGYQEASETGVPGATVYLDNRYAVRTDAQGRFEFPFVAAGPRTVTVRNETLPLPWGVVDEGQVKVDVRLRESTQLSIPVQRND